MHDVSATQSMGIRQAGVNTAHVHTKVRNERMAGFVPSYTNNPIEQGGAQETVFNKGEEGFGFFDLLDMINPLQHLPLVNIAYRKITGDEIKPISSIVGGALYGGPVGAASNVISHVIEDGTGKSPVENVLSMGRSRPDEMQAYKDLPAEMLIFAQTPSLNNQNYDYNT